MDKKLRAERYLKKLANKNVNKKFSFKSFSLRNKLKPKNNAIKFG